MLSRFEDHLKVNLPFLKDKKLLLACSGGIDSMVLAHLLKQLDYPFSIAHCNFMLRGEESDADEDFVRNYASCNNIPVYITHFDTMLFATDNKLSLQVAARQLRYGWFNELLRENGLDYLLTAHHLDDSAETFLINFTRGTGLEGLTGIPQQNEAIVRPLLPFTREEVEAYARENSIIWREDSSNATDKYLRNRVRHDVVPVLKSLNPLFGQSFQQTLKNLQQAKSLADDAAILVYRQVVTEHKGRKHIDIRELARLTNYRAYLYRWLSPFGFTAWEDIYALADAQPGKYVLAGPYRLLKDRKILILERIVEDEVAVHEIYEGMNTISTAFRLSVSDVTGVSEDSLKNTLYADKEKLKFPLFVRKWQAGDYFYPVGMNGQKKKVSKYFKDEKMSLSEKEGAWLLCSGSQVVWIINKRADERFKPDNNTTQIIKIEVL
ncbi:tRNA lysidine(34) synthetase TilS [Flavobacterium cyanobacteriorum]|uniref:tRNA(Ile)-lysidine synthase n=1 Tax=Flavobacterium cyanobacteriorum TaxID=2022802 RepID=A0A255YSA7_9FLAO|nr:tRNA lysidine(34) synthetase TilS [Flavobacterium cyanobacteriorum]OYQ32077.1 tRNA lysidine(34) synthetase TilS [Flavobacterium cyanobacteriorum]